MKVFGIGFHKTATTSLSDALRCLGYRVHGGVTSDKVSTRLEAKQKAREICRKYDALQDMPWPIMYKWLDQEYPDSKFILTVRSENEWIKSVCRHFGGRYIKRHDWIYGKGDPNGNEELYLERYKKHNKEVIDYFEGRVGNDLLVMDITRGDGWGKVCPFLGEPVPIVPFPSSNMSNKKWKHASFKKKVSTVLKNVATEVTARFRRGMKILANFNK